jgi:hypothetical protein
MWDKKIIDTLFFTRPFLKIKGRAHIPPFLPSPAEKTQIPEKTFKARTNLKNSLIRYFPPNGL